jgi:hypothetical protein
MNRIKLLKQSLLIAALSIPLLASCSDKAFAPFDWKEEIQLHDGRKVIAERVDTYGGPREPSQSEPNTKDRTIRFADPSDPKKTYTHKITGSSNYLMLDFHEGKPWLVVFVGPFSTDTKCPIGTYDTYAWDGGQWVQRAFKGRPKEFVKPNMSLGYVVDDPDKRRKGQVLSAAAIETLQKRMKRHGVAEPIWNFIDVDIYKTSTDCADFWKK